MKCSPRIRRLIHEKSIKNVTCICQGDFYDKYDKSDSEDLITKFKNKELNCAQFINAIHKKDNHTD